MSQYKHRMTLAVPQQYMVQANQLALIVGESADDDNTFTLANYQDSKGSLYAVCSTAIKPVVLSTFGLQLADYPLRPHAELADVAQAQQALDMAVMYEQGMTASKDIIHIAIDVEPMTFFEGLGLTVVEIEDI